jgi:WD40 repeat protein
MAVATSPDGTWLATASDDETLRLWDRDTGTLLHSLTGHTDMVRAAAISSDGTWLASASGDGTVRVWDRATGTAIAALRTDSWLLCLAVHESLIVVAGSNGPYFLTLSHGG